MSATEKPVLLATVFSDYICPFCYIGDLRLDRLRALPDCRALLEALELLADARVDTGAPSDTGFELEGADDTAAALDGVLLQPGCGCDTRRGLPGPISLPAPISLAGLLSLAGLFLRRRSQ